MQQLAVERLREARVADGGIDAALAQLAGRVERDLHAGPVADQRHPLALGQRLAGADRGSSAARAGSGTPTAAPRG